MNMKRDGIGFVEISRNGLIPSVSLMTPNKDPEERGEGIHKFFEPFDGHLVKISVEVFDDVVCKHYDPKTERCACLDGKCDGHGRAIEILDSCCEFAEPEIKAIARRSS